MTLIDHHIYPSNADNAADYPAKGESSYKNIMQSGLSQLPAGAYMWITYFKSFFKDARHGQILMLSCLLILGMTMLDFAISVTSVAGVFISALVTQLICHAIFLRHTAAPLDIRSPLITALSLNLLLRADISTVISAWPLYAAGALAIASKFIFRLRNKHIFNPANIAIVTLLILAQYTDIPAWTTPGQWGPLALAGFAMAGIGFFVTYAAARLDVPFIFLGFYGALIFGRAFYLGDPMTIPWLNFQNGALILFAFFMISDPRTTPDSFWGRVIFCGFVAGLGYIIQYHYYNSDGLFYALALGCALRPILDMISTAPKFLWPAETRGAVKHQQSTYIQQYQSRFSK